MLHTVQNDRKVLLKIHINTTCKLELSPMNMNNFTLRNWTGIHFPEDDDSNNESDHTT